MKLFYGDLNQKVVEKLINTNNNVKFAGRGRLGEANEGAGRIHDDGQIHDLRW